MSREETATVCVCDRCGERQASAWPRYEGDPGRPSHWATVTFSDGTVNSELDLCMGCANSCGSFLRNASDAVPVRMGRKLRQRQAP